ncbi:MAG: hypothetical protein QM758_15380 [Armatimonas sp.]
MDPQDLAEDEIKQQWARYDRRHLIFDVTDGITVGMTNCQISRTWEGWQMVGNKDDANNRVLESIDRRFNVWREDDGDITGYEDRFIIFPYELPRNGLLPYWCWVFQFRGGHKDVGDTTYYVHGKIIVYFSSSLEESPYAIAEKVVSQVEWEVQSKPYEGDEWD